MLAFRNILTWGRNSYRRILKWDESKVQRNPAGSANSTGGQFAARSAGSISASARHHRWEKAVGVRMPQPARSYHPAPGMGPEHYGTGQTGDEMFQAVLEHRPPVPGEVRPTGFQNVPRAEGFDPTKLRRELEDAPSEALQSGEAKSVTRLGDASNANASYLVTLEDGTKAVFKPEIGEAWNLSFSNKDISDHITNTDFSLAEREAMASEVSKGLGFGELVPETHLREEFALPGIDPSDMEDDKESSGGYDTYEAREQYEQYKQSMYEKDDYYDEVGEEMERLFEEAKGEHFTDLQNRNEELSDIWNELVEDHPDQTPYGNVEELQKHPRLPLGSAQSFHRQTLQGVVDPLEVMDEAKVDPSYKLTDAEKARVREVLAQRLKDGYQELGDVDEDAAREHLDRDEWYEAHQDTEVRIRDEALEKRIKSYTEWRHDEGMYTEEGGGGGVKNPNAPHPNGGSLQRFVQDASPWGSLSTEDGAKVAVLDYALGSMDRHHKNMLYIDGKPVAIDNGYSMPDSNDVTFRSRPVKEWKTEEDSGDLSEAVRNPMLEALKATDWQAMADRHPNMNVDERQAFLDRIGRLKKALTTPDGLLKLWARQSLYG